MAGGADSNDLYAVNLAAAAWQNLTGGLQGTPPTRRAYHAMAAAGNAVYLFGGSDPAGRSHAYVGACFDFGGSNLTIFFWASGAGWQAPCKAV